MDAYIFQAALLCEDCAADIKTRLAANAAEEDSDRYPQGPYSNGGGEADRPQHCDSCHVFLENELTGDGYDYVREALEDNRDSARGNPEVLKEWSDFYGIDVESSEESTS